MYDLKEFVETTKRFYNKEVSVGDYKGFSGNFGSYAQRGGERSMLRLRMTGGIVSRDKAVFIADMVKRYGISLIHATTCQTIQLHNLDRDTVCDLIALAPEQGIYTVGGGGDNPRNVMASPLSGIDPEEYFDVAPYAEAAADYLLAQIGKIKLPRKLKVGFSSSPKNECHVTFRDLGFMAKENGRFDVYSAGGLGNNAKMGLKVAEDIEPQEILYYIKAMIDTFIAHGNYKVRAKARTRYMQDELGAEGYIKAFAEALDNARDEDLTIDIPSPGTYPDWQGETHGRIHPQKQPGRYYVTYHPIGGNPPAETFVKIAGLMNEENTLRLAPDSTIYIAGCTLEQAESFAEVTADGAATSLEASTSCIGSAICQIGIQNSQLLLKSIIEAVKEKGFSDGVLPKLHISGCTSSCGAHQTAEIGFSGRIKRVDNQPVPSFLMMINGCDELGRERFGEEMGIIAAERIPQMMVEIGESVAAAGMVYSDWIRENRAAFDAIVKKYL